MKILFLAPRLPFPADTGAKIRTFNLLKQIVRVHKVHLLSFSFTEDSQAQQELKDLGIDLTIIKKTEALPLLAIFGEKPLSIAKYFSADFLNTLKTILKNGKFDLIHFDHLHMGQYISSIGNIPTVLDEHNVEAVILKRCAQKEPNLLKRTLFIQQAAKMRAFEAALVNKFSVCLTVSDEDRRILCNLSQKTNIEVVTNGVDMEYFKASPLRVQSLSNQKDVLVFTGSMDWLPNIDSIEYFCNSILPLIWQNKPNTVFYVVGKNPPKKILTLQNSDSRIIITGSVADVRTYMDKAKVFVVPLRIGGGTRLKIVEAMSYGIPVVSTRIGAEGIEAKDEKHLLLADSSGEFAEKVCRLIGNSTLRSDIAINARQLVEKQYDWKNIGIKLLSVYENITRK